MIPSPVTDLKPFVPAKDAALSREFYADLGFTINWSNDQIAELQIGSFRFLLQTFYVAEHAGNFMMSLAVEDADAWWEYIQKQDLVYEISGHHVQAPADAALGNSRALSERSDRRPVAHHGHAQVLSLTSAVYFPMDADFAGSGNPRTL